MNKIVKILSCIAMCFSFTGCFSTLYTRNATNTIDTSCSGCKEVTNIESLVDNVEYTMNQVDAVRGSYNLVNTKQTFEVNFDIITNDKRVNWDAYATTKIDEKEIVVYLKDSKFYIIYPNNGANVIIKDDIADIVSETEDTLDKLNATYQKDNLKNMMTGNKLEGFIFDEYKEKGTYKVNDNGTYTMFYEDSDLSWEFDISSSYLIEEVRCSAINFNSTLELTYPKDISINYPMGLDFLTVDIGDVKKMLEINSFAELIDEDLKESK